MTLHPVVAAAAGGVLPPWAQADARRRAHMERVADLMEGWGTVLGLKPKEVTRWRGVGLLHDVLRDAPAHELRPLVAPELRSLPDPLLHGPAGAVRLREEGVEDESLLHAVAFHTLGHPDLDRMGRALYAADFLEPGRSFLPEWRGELRNRMPHAPDEVVREVLLARLDRLEKLGSPIRPETRAFLTALGVEVAP